MATVRPSLLRRYIRRITSLIKDPQRRQRATLVALENLKPAINHDLKPTINDLKPAISDVKSSISDLKPPINDLKPAISDQKSSINDLKPAINDLKPAINTNLKPTINDLKPAINDLKPAINTNLKPTINDLKPAINDLKPAINTNLKPTTNDLKPAINNLKPSISDLKPAINHGIEVGRIKSYEELPTPSGYPFLGTLPEMLAAGGTKYYHKYVTRRHEELGGIYKESLGGSELVFVSDPMAVKQVFAAEGPHPQHFIPQPWLLYNQDRQVTRGLFFMEGEEWRVNRSVLNRRLLRPGAVTPHLRAFSRVADSLINRWFTKFPNTPIPNLERELYHWAIESLGVMVLGERLGFLQGKEKPQDQQHMETFIDAIHGIFKETSALGTLPPALARFLRIPVWTRLVKSVDTALASGRQLVESGLALSMERERSGEPCVTLLDHLLRQDKLHPNTIVCLITDLFLAAADTMSHTTMWSLYLLGRHPKEAQRARREIIDVTDGSGDVDTEHLASLPYLKGVVKEALRLYPVAPFLTRALSRDAMILGYHIPAGKMMIMSMYKTGRDPEHFPNPDQFCPERWVRDAFSRQSESPGFDSQGESMGCPVSKPNSHACLPFGFGVRSCIGRRVAETQLQLLLAKLLSRTNLTVLNEVDMVLRMVAVTSDPVQLRLGPLPLMGI